MTMNARVDPVPARSGAPCGCGGVSSKKDCGCGGAGCGECRTDGYVRPRFFAGQLLTEEDLQALAEYVTAKNRLHNRHLMGSGVVCGLQATCQPCGGGKIVVQPGYALDCCGNDIVLECAKELDVNAMVRDLRRSMLGGYDCGDPCAKEKSATPTGDQQSSVGAGEGNNSSSEQKKESRHYCLYVRYCEQEADPVAPYATDEPCGQVACEPSRLREGLRFELRCRKEPGAPDDFVHRLVGCVGDLTGSAALLKNFVALLQNPDANAVATVKEDLLDRLDRSPNLTDCGLRAYVQAVAVPAVGTTDASAAGKLLHAYMRLVRDCICEAMNPSCPPCEDPGVLLACLEISECEVVDICNLERTYVLTAPAFRYWYGILVDRVAELLEQFCCRQLPELELKPIGKKEEAGGAAASTVAAEMAKTSAAPGAEKTAFAASASGAGIDVGSLLKERMKAAVRGALGVSPRDLGNLDRMVRSLGELAGHGAFDRVAPGLALLRSLDLGKELPKFAVERVKESDTVRLAMDALIDERVGQRLAELKARSEESVAAEVDRRVKELDLEARLQQELSGRDQEIVALKREVDTLRSRVAEFKPKGTPK
jgi:hypothetical protein